jgi:hypothetical protein
MGENPRKTVFVLGAGFTKAFLPSAPLVEDEYLIWTFLQANPHFKQAHRLIELEEERCGKGRINIERLMTRLSGMMPYDRDQLDRMECSMLLHVLKQAFLEKLRHAINEGEYHRQDLLNFALFCIKNSITCVTFNYDDFLDRELWAANEELSKQQFRTYWHPEGGYGFFCQPAMRTIYTGDQVSMDKTALLLLKMHGSVNWRVRLGAAPPIQPDSLLTFSTWHQGVPPAFYAMDQAEMNDSVLRHLEEDPFIVPPVLAKTDLLEQPVLKLIWTLAYRKLSQADAVVFIGYSLPATDLAAGFLFGETLNRPDCQISIVNKDMTEGEEQELRRTYRMVFPKVSEKQFAFIGALEWSRRLVRAEISLS